MFNKLKQKTLKKEAKIAVMGLGYVGLPLAVEFAKADFSVTGIDTDEERIAKINKGLSYILDVSSEEVNALVSKKILKAQSDTKILKEMDVIIICVPTPLRKTREPDISYIISATDEIAKNFKKGKLIVLESTTYPGTTEEVILPKLDSGDFKVGKDFFLAFSPERVDPGNKIYKTKDIPKVVGGITKNCTELARLLYSQIINEVISVSSTRVAEMVKLLENTYRIVNIGLVNEIALMCNKLGIDVWEVIDAAKSKPFGFMPFYPGPGAGGHCIPCDPIYLSWKARMHGFEARFIELASQINLCMPNFVVERIASGLNENSKSLKGSEILILGVTYKKDVCDTRESPALEIISLLQNKGAKVSYHDPFVSRLEVNWISLESIRLTKKGLNSKDCTVIVTDHSGLDYEFVLDNSRLIVDTRNVLKSFDDKKIIRL